MDENKKISINFGGTGFCLFIIFLVLKLTNIIDWAWIWICAPIWIPLALVVGFLVIYFLILLIAALITAIWGY